MSTKNFGIDNSDFVKAEIEKRLKSLEVTVKHKLNHNVSFYEITVTDGIAYARQEIGEYNLDGSQQSAFLDRVAAGLVHVWATERYLAKSDPRQAHTADPREAKPL